MFGVDNIDYMSKVYVVAVVVKMSKQNAEKVLEIVADKQVVLNRVLEEIQRLGYENERTVAVCVIEKSRWLSFDETVQVLEGFV